MWLTEFALRHDHRPEVMLQSGYGWYTEPHYRFDIGFIEEETGTGPMSQRTRLEQSGALEPPTFILPHKGGGDEGLGPFPVVSSRSHEKKRRSAQVVRNRLQCGPLFGRSSPTHAFGGGGAPPRTTMSESRPANAYPETDQ